MERGQRCIGILRLAINDSSILLGRIQKPFPEYGAIGDLLGIYPNRVDYCEVDGERVQSQTGKFYAGWITKHLKGPFKGDPGTQGW